MMFGKKNSTKKTGSWWHTWNHWIIKIDNTKFKKPTLKSKGKFPGKNVFL